MSNIRTVSELNSYINRLLSNDFFLKNIAVKGEISGISKPINGHIYFTIKDAKCSIPCALFRNRNKNVNIKLENGIEVVINGSVSMYEVNGKCQIIVDDIKIGDYGKLHKKYLELKTYMDKLGYFDVSSKKDMPDKISSLALVTSVSSAAITDFLTVIKRRNPFIDVEVFDVRVQGNSCPEEVSKAINKINELNRHDLIALTRGGGSEEELFVFNDIDINTAIVNSKIPVATAIGHQRDVSLSELSSDIKSDTPTSLAEIITEGFYKSRIVGLEATIDKMYESTFSRLRHEKNMLNFAINTLMSEKDNKFMLATNSTLNMKNQLLREVVFLIETMKKDVTMKYSLLCSYDYKNVLNRGYSLVYKEGELADYSKLKTGDIIEVISADNSLKAEVLEVNNIGK